ASLRHHRALLLTTALLTAALVAFHRHAGDPRLVAGLFAPYLLLFWACLSALGLLLTLALHRRQLGRREPALTARAAWSRAWRQVRQGHLTWPQLWNGVLAGGCIALLFNVFASWKRYFPAVRPFTWDPALSQLDRWLHGGRLPQEYLAPWLASDALTWLMDRVYTSWYAVVGCMMVVWLWQHDSYERRRLLLGLVGVKFLLGVLLATVFASAGPCFFHAVTGLPDPYAPHMAALSARAAELSLQVPKTQEKMWAMYAQGTTPLYHGIAAMPSLHVAIPALFTLATWRLHRPSAMALAAFTIVTLLATIYLGWHYAVDGYASVVLVGAYWVLTRRVPSRAGALARSDAPLGTCRMCEG
ncbi:MAG TPA: phosphatase PAP2 family protein, partial [Gemmatimonadales bacterium]|nr:phosphatase PAP2 family protein [Gemmatimonadales bacterium]